MSQGNRIRGNPQSVQKLLDENAQLIQAIVDYQNKGKAAECVQYQQLLHKNLVYLATLADSTQNISAMLPPPPAASQISGTTTGVMGPPFNNLPTNPQDRIMGNVSVDRGSPGMPIMTSQASSQMPGVMHTAPAQTAVTGNATINSTYGGNIVMSPQATLDTNLPTSSGYQGNVNQMMTSPLASTGQSMLTGQQHQGYMNTMHSARMQQQSQGQFVMQQGVSMGFNRPPAQQMHLSQGHQPQQMNQQQAYIANQPVPGQPTPGMLPYQQAGSTYDPYNQMQQMSTGYGNPYGPP